MISQMVWIEVQAKYIKDLYKECLREGTLLNSGGRNENSKTIS